MLDHGPGYANLVALSVICLVACCLCILLHVVLLIPGFLAGF